jgi:hypothetical protein
MDTQGGGGFAALGRSTEITRDELKFAKFITRLRNKFSQIFDQALQTQLVLKNICTKDEWEKFREDIYYDFNKDNNFMELSESEVLRERLATLQLVEPFVVKYFSQTWIKKNVLHMSDEEVKEMDKEMKKDGSVEQYEQMQQQQSGGMIPQPPVDNTVENDTAQESPTPELDSAVERFSGSINRR